MIKILFLILAGTAYGVLSSAGVFTVLAAVGLVPRFAGRTHTADKVLLYEEMVIFGTIVGCIFSVFSRYCTPAAWLLAHFPNQLEFWRMLGRSVQLVFGFFAGTFIGCLALAIADAGQYSHIYKKDFFQTWSGLGDFKHGSRKALRCPAVLFTGASPDSGIGKRRCAKGAGRNGGLGCRM